MRAEQGRGEEEKQVYQEREGGRRQKEESWGEEEGGGGWRQNEGQRREGVSYLLTQKEVKSFRPAGGPADIELEGRSDLEGAASEKLTT